MSQIFHRHGRLQLFYFRAKGSADKVRLLFEELGIAYEDVYVKNAQDVSHFNSHLGALPIVASKKSNLVIPYPRCILRYFARECSASLSELFLTPFNSLPDLFGSNEDEMLRIDAWLERLFEFEAQMWTASHNEISSRDRARLRPAHQGPK